MEAGTKRTRPSRRAAVLLFAAAAAAYALRPAASTGEAATPAPQDLIRVESRIGRLEQRFYSVEASIRGLEQQLRAPAAVRGSGARDPEVGLLRAEVESLRRRLADVECGLSRVDERTLTPAAREARRKSSAGNADPCRLDADAPLRPATRP
ncbi:MAG TPA: hypothetical protein VGB98_15640 [Pyrinomonadaceae bacterium]|jgi:hypothetical protein